MNDWKIKLISIENDTRVFINASMETERFDFLQEKSKELSQKIIETEENLIIKSIETKALERLKTQIENELISRLK